MKQRKQHRAARVLLAAAAIGGAAICGGCARPGSSAEAQPTAADWQKVTEDAARLRADARQFDQAHSFKGLTVQQAVSSLAAQAYACQLSYVDTSEAVPGQPFTYRPLRLPYIHCIRPEPPQDGLCKARQVTLDVQWQDRAASPDGLARQYAHSLVEGHLYRCRTEDPGDPIDPAWRIKP